MNLRVAAGLLIASTAALLASPKALGQTGIPDFDNPSFRPASRFVEITPRITTVEVKQGDPFVEVFISGFVALDCYDVREYHVEKADVLTRIVPRFRKSKPDGKCNDKVVAFREKAADLDPNSPATHRVDVLGYYGWHTEYFKGATPPGAPIPATAPVVTASLATTESSTAANAKVPTVELPPGGTQAVTPLAKTPVEPPPPPPKVVEPVVTPSPKKLAKKAAQKHEPEETAVSEDLDPVEEYPVNDAIPAGSQTPPPAPMNTDELPTGEAH